MQGYKFRLHQAIGEDVSIDRDVYLTQAVDITDYVYSGADFAAFGPAGSQTQYYILIRNVPRSTIASVIANRPTIIDIGTAGTASVTDPQITKLTSERGWEWATSGYFVPATSRITVRESLTWDVSGLTGSARSYQPNDQNAQLIFIKLRITGSGALNGTYYGIIFDDRVSDLCYAYFAIEDAFSEPVTPPDTPSETPTVTPNGHYGIGVTQKGNMTFVNYAQALSRVNTGSHGLRMYSVGDGAIDALYSRLWSADIWDKWANRKFSPIGGILSLHRVPVIAPTVGTVSSVTIAGQQYPVGSAQLVSDNIVTIDFGAIEIPEISGSFLDYSPYCSAMLYLPFIGAVGIDINAISDGYIAVRYTFDLISGNCIAQVLTIDRDRSSIIYGTYPGNAAYKYPISGNDNGGFAVLGAAAGIATAGLSLAATGGSAAPLAASIVSGAATSISAEHHLQQAGTLPANTAALGDLRVYLVITRPAYLTPDHYVDVKGYPAGDGHTVGSYTGLLAGELHAESITGATDAEKQEIESAFRGGVFV